MTLLTGETLKKNVELSNRVEWGGCQGLQCVGNG